VWIRKEILFCQRQNTDEQPENVGGSDLRVDIEMQGTDMA